MCHNTEMNTDPYFIIAMNDPSNKGASIAFQRAGSTKNIWGALGDAKKFNNLGDIIDHLEANPMDNKWEVHMILEDSKIYIWSKDQVMGVMKK